MTKMPDIRKAAAADVESVWEIRRAAILDQCPGYYPRDVLEVWVGGAPTDQFIEVVERSIYLAVVDQKVVGTGMVDLETGQIDAVFVHPDCIGSGVGRAMMGYLERLARAAGLGELRLDATLNAARFYRACGFAGEALGKYESPRGVTLDCVPMVKSLRLRDSA